MRPTNEQKRPTLGPKPSRLLLREHMCRQRPWTHILQKERAYIGRVGEHTADICPIYIIERAYIGPPTPQDSRYPHSENAVSPMVSHRYQTHTHLSLPYPYAPPPSPHAPRTPRQPPHLHPLFLGLHRYMYHPPRLCKGGASEGREVGSRTRAYSVSRGSSRSCEAYAHILMRRRIHACQLA
jgi:hypothetical protein